MPPRSPRKQSKQPTAPPRNGAESDSDEEDDIFGDDEHRELIAETNFDAFFKASASRQPTSSSVLSSLVEPLTQQEYISLISTLPPPFRIDHDEQFARYKRELDMGFNLLFYGYGSKKSTLDHFADQVLSQTGNVLIFDAYEPEFTLKTLLSSIEHFLELPTGTSSTPESIYTQLSFSTSSEHLYLVINSLDAPSLRSHKARAALSLLALHPSIHLVASTDHINAPLLFTSIEATARKHPPLSSPDDPIPNTRGYAWIWHDLTTLAPYDRELAHADRSSISGYRKPLNTSLTTTTAVGGSGGAKPGQEMTESAAIHILASVTARAKKLFQLMGLHQLQLSSSSEDSGGGGGEQSQGRISYDALFQMARNEFLATNDTTMRSLLFEFRDHGLVASVSGGAAGGGAEMLWIPMRKERLERVLKDLQKDSSSSSSNS